MDVETRCVYDSRIVQKRPTFAVEKGGVSVKNAAFPAVKADTDQHVFDVLVPSETTFVDRAVDWTSKVGVAITINFPARTISTPLEAGTYTLNFGYGTIPVIPATNTFVAAVTPAAAPPFFDYPWGWAASPLHSLTRNIEAIINDTKIQINTERVLKEVLRLVDIRANTLQRTAPNKLDTTAYATQDTGLINGTYGNYYANGVIQEEIPNSANWFSGEDPIKYTPYVSKTTGAPLPLSLLSDANTLNSLVGGGGAYYDITTPSFSAGTISLSSLYLYQQGGIGGAFSFTISGPVLSFTIGAWSLTLYAAGNFTERLVLSPFIFNDVKERDTGLFGIQSILLTMNMRNPQDCRLIRQRAVNGQYVLGESTSATSIPSVTLTSAYSPVFSGRVFDESRVDFEFITPSLDMPPPARSIVPHKDYIPYTTQYSATSDNFVSTFTSKQYITSRIQLPEIPDYLIVYARPQGYNQYDSGSPVALGSEAGDWYLPISQLSLQWENIAGMLSTYSQQQLYRMSIRNGLLQDYQQWSGRLPSGSCPDLSVTDAFGQAVGGFIVLRPGIDFAIPLGEAAGTLGRYNIQLTLTLNNYSFHTILPEICVVAVQSGFFESSKGSSRVVKGVPSVKAVLHSGPAGPAVETPRAIGNGRRK